MQKTTGEAEMDLRAVRYSAMNFINIHHAGRMNRVRDFILLVCKDSFIKIN